jgi:serine/threonine protein kinase
MEGYLPLVGGGIAPGSQIGQYLLEEQIGQGGMAAMFRAVDQRLGRRVALKILLFIAMRFVPLLASPPPARYRAGG